MLKISGREGKGSRVEEFERRATAMVQIDGEESRMDGALLDKAYHISTPINNLSIILLFLFSLFFLSKTKYIYFRFYYSQP